MECWELVCGQLLRCTGSHSLIMTLFPSWSHCRKPEVKNSLKCDCGSFAGMCVWEGGAGFVYLCRQLVITPLSSLANATHLKAVCIFLSSLQPSLAVSTLWDRSPFSGLLAQLVEGGGSRPLRLFKGLAFLQSGLAGTQTAQPSFSVHVRWGKQGEGH